MFRPSSFILHPSSFILSTLLLTFLPQPGQGQTPLPPPPECGPSPLLYVRFTGPAGARVTLFQGTAGGREYPLPATIGLRPGYLHWVRLSDLPGLPGVTLAPTLEVRGTLYLPPRMRAADYPVPIVLTEHDLERVLNGSLLTKVIYLEDPEKAIPEATHSEEPLETDVPGSHDLLAEARRVGRPMLVVRVGGRDVPRAELAHQSVPGTILLPGEQVLTPAARPPTLPPICFPTYDPLAGPRPPQEECLHDGGDQGSPAGLDREGRLHGLDPADTIAEYSDNQGRRHLSCSNRVCLCVPRYAVLRTETPLAGYDVTVGPAARQQVQEELQIQTRQPPRQTFQNEQLAAMQVRQQPSANIGTQGLAQLVRVEVLTAEQVEIGPAVLLGTTEVLQLTAVQRTRLLRQIQLARELSRVQGPQSVSQEMATAVVGRIEGLGLVTSSVETRDLTVCCHEGPHPPERPLCLFKWANAQSAQVGDVVTFYLKYSNHGGQPINDVALNDSLTGRLEYVPGSAHSDRDAVFTTQPNEAGSLTLRWEISGRLLPGQHGVVSFQARVR